MRSAIAFGPFRLNPANAELRRGRQPVLLRPKTYAVLQYLAERPGLLVSKDELLEAVWPDITVTDGAIKVCMAELRKALGDDAHRPAFIETVHRRGYRFVARIRAADAGTRRDTVVQSSRPAAPLIVGRDAELARLRSWLDAGMGGARQIVFVSGEPGIGKTTLLDAFLHAELEARDATVMLARGQCVEQYGTAEAYLPVLEGLGRLCRQPAGAHLVRLLRDHAPSWLMQVPGVLGNDDRVALQREYAGVSRERMLRELVVGLEALTAETGMILVLEDVHWGDRSTLELLAALARRREPARLVVIATCRPVEHLGNGDALGPILRELTLHRHGAELPLDGLTAAAVIDYLAARFPEAPFSRALGTLIHQHTDGNPLFMVNVTDHLIAQGMIGPAGKTWALLADRTAIEREVPKSLRHMIRLQLDGLAVEARETLEAASVVGVEFAAPTVAAAVAAPVERVEQACQGLMHRRLLRPLAAAEWPDGTTAAQYAFAHALYQHALYERLTPARRSRLHRHIGERREAAYGSRANEIAAELAMHFDRGQDAVRAVQYYRQAGASAVQRHAYHEATAELDRALALLSTRPATPDRDRQELELRVLLGVPQLNTQGFAAPEVERTYARALALCRSLGETPQLFSVLEGLHSFYAIRGELPTAYDLAQQLLRLGERTGDRIQLLEAHHTLGCSEFWRGELAAARGHFETALALYDPAMRATAFQQSGHDPMVCCLSNLGVTLWFIGYPDQALQRAHDALAFAESLAHPDSLALARALTAWVHLLRGESQRAQLCAEAALALAREHRLPYWAAQATILRGSALARQGDAARGETQLQRGLGGYEAIGAGVARTEYLALRADVYARSGRPAEGLETLEQAFAVVDRQGERYLEPELLRLKGELLLQRGSPPQSRTSAVNAAADATGGTHAQAEQCFQQALAVARRQHSASLELRAARSLSRQCLRHGETTRARQALREVYARFTEGFDTADLKAAASLLAELEQDPTARPDG